MTSEIEGPSERSLDGLREKVLARLDEAFVAAMGAFEASKAITKTRVTYNPSGSVEETRSEVASSGGDPRHLQQALKAIEATRQLAGLDAPLRSACAHLVAIQARMPGPEGIPVAEQPRAAIEAWGSMNEIDQGDGGHSSQQ
jgi:hypothetical protein